MSGVRVTLPKHTRAKLSPVELMHSAELHNCLAESFTDISDMVHLLRAMRSGSEPLSKFVSGVEGDYRGFWRKNRKLVSAMLNPERITEWASRGRNDLHWVLIETVRAASRSTAGWFHADGQVSWKCPKRYRIGVRLLYRRYLLTLEAAGNPDLAEELRQYQDRLYDGIVSDPRAHSALAFLMLIWLPCVIHYGLTPSQLLRRARSPGFDLRAIDALLRLDPSAAGDRRVLKLIDSERLSNRRGSARAIAKAMGGSLPPINEFTAKARVAGLFRNIVGDNRILNTESARRVADAVARQKSKGRTLRDTSLGADGERFTKAVYRASILFAAVRRK